MTGGRTHGNQSGVTLIVILLMMLALSFIALGAMSVSVVQERMAGNLRDQEVALQAAEAALRDAEADVQANLSAASAFSVGCVNGLCMPPSMLSTGATSAPIWQSINWSTQARAYGSATGAAPLVGPANQPLASQPAYIIEILPVLQAQPGESACLTCAPPVTGQPFRITVRAFGVRSTTMVMLQSTYVKQ